MLAGQQQLFCHIKKKHKSNTIIPLRPAPDPSDHCLPQTQCWQGETGLPWLMCIQNPMEK